MEAKTGNKLKEIGNRLPYQVPENYFDSFALEMDARIGATRVSMKKMFAPWMYMAAMFVGLLLLGNVFLSVYKTNKAQNQEMYELYVMSQLDDSVLMDYYYNTANFDED